MANLRSGGSKEYKIPEGFAFNKITCANYFFEIWGWLLFGVATQTLAAFLFIAAGGFQMMQWALQKHKRLRKVGAPLTVLCLVFASLYGIAYKPDVFDDRRAVSHYSSASFSCLQLFDGKEGRLKYPRRWVIFPPLL